MNSYNTFNIKSQWQTYIRQEEIYFCISTNPFSISIISSDILHKTRHESHKIAK